MKMTIDPVSGMAGDMFIAALISAGAPQRDVEDIMNYAGNLLGKALVSAKQIEKNGISGIQLSCQYQSEKDCVTSDVLEEMLEKVLKEYSLQRPYAAFAEFALSLICQAEARAHDTMHSPDGEADDTGHCEIVTLHEAQDILVDIAGSAFALHSLKIKIEETKCFTPVFYGGGQVTFSHGTFTVPAPATAQLINLNDIPTAAGPVEKELLTPTGAALLAALEPRWTVRNEMNVAFARRGKTGVGFGTYEFPAGLVQPNALNVYLQ